MKRKLIILLIALMPFPAFSETHTEKVKALMEARGLFDTLETQFATIKAQSEKMGQQGLEQILAQLNPNEAYKQRFAAANKSYMEKMLAPFASQDIVDFFVSHYGQNLTDQELDKLIEFYTSDLGKKEIAASKQAAIAFTDHYYKEVMPVTFTKVTKEYAEELKKIAIECKCSKKKP